MKKIFVLFAVLLLITAAVPFVGNKLVSDALDEKINFLTANGIEVKETTTAASYLHTKKYYQFLIKDSEKFLNYINQYSRSDIPSYVKEIFDGIEVGMDISYTNIPYLNAIEINAYPLTLAPQTMKDMQSEDKHFYEFFTTFLEKKGLLYHLKYDMFSQEFNGFVKDMNEEYLSTDGTKMKISLLGMEYNGSGDLFAPIFLNSKMQTFSFEGKKDKNALKFTFEGLASASDFESRSKYSNAFSLENMNVALSGEEKFFIDVKDVKVSLASDTQNTFAKMYAKSSFKEFHMSADAITTKVQDFNYDISLNEMDKEALEELQDVIAEAKSTSSDTLELKMRESFVKLLSRGVVLNVDDFSFKNIVLEDGKNLNAISLTAQISFKEDPTLANKLLYTPALLAQNLDTEMRLNISKEIFAKINETTPMAMLVMQYAKKVADNYVFEVYMKNSELMVNGQIITN